MILQKEFIKRSCALISFSSLLLFSLLFFQNCSSNSLQSGAGPDAINSNNEHSVPSDPAKTCSTAEIEQALSKSFFNIKDPYPDLASTDPFDMNDFSFIVERADGRQLIINGANALVTDLYESASTSKLISAVIILRSIEKGALSLDDKPQKYISGWPITSSSSLYNITLKQLLSFTSGLTEVPACLYNPALESSYEKCILSIGSKNLASTVVPGAEFKYSPTHLQVAGLMAVKARGGAITTWQDLFSEFKSETGLFSSSSYDIPSSGSPLLSGGMHWKGTEYLAFLKALKNGKLLGSILMNEILSDQTNLTPLGEIIKIEDTPINKGIGEDWHYGFGSWQECQNSTYNCAPGTRISSPGAYGSYPFWDRGKNYIGVLAHKSSDAGEYPKGIGVERSIRAQVEEWINCD